MTKITNKQPTAIILFYFYFNFFIMQIYNFYRIQQNYFC